MYGIRNRKTIIYAAILSAGLLYRFSKNSGIVALFRCWVISLVHLPRIIQGRSEPKTAFPIPIQVDATPNFHPNWPA